MERKGFILLARKTLDSQIWVKPLAYFKIWIFILLKVSHTDGLFPRGTNFFRWADVNHELAGVTINQWNECVRWLKSTRQITTQKTTRGNIITVVKYGQYQDIASYTTTQNTTHSPESLQNNSDTISKELKKIKKNTLSPKVDAIVPPKKKPPSFTSIEQLLESKLPHLQLIGKYFLLTGKQFSSPETLTIATRRWMKDAAAICKFTDEEIEKALSEAEEHVGIWNLGTVLKKLTK